MNDECTCHERDSSYTCDACHEEGYFGHMESHLEKEWLEKRIAEAKEFNRKVGEFRSLPESTGCIGALGCEHCGELNYGTCLCMGLFTCERCGEANDIWKIPKMEDIIADKFDYSTLLVEPDTTLQDLIDEAKSIIDDPDGYDLLFDFVLGIAGLDGDPEYQ